MIAGALLATIPGRLVVAALVATAIGCGRPAPAPERREPAATATSAGPAAAAAAVDLARCAQHRDLLAGLAAGPPPGFSDEAVLVARDHDPVKFDTRPIPAADADLAHAAVELVPGDAATAAKAITGPRAYLRVRRDTSHATSVRADLAALRDAVPLEVELRVLLARTDVERLATLMAIFPDTSPRLQGQLLMIDGFSTGAHRLIAMAGRCGAALLALEPVKGGVGIDTVGPAVADALGRCDCALADLDGFVTLIAWLLLPLPELGWLPIETVAAGAP